MKIVPSAAADLGELGQQLGQGTSYDWKWYYSTSGLAIWLPLLLVFVLPKANHDVRILWILVPLVIVNLLWLAFKAVSGMPSSIASQFDTVFHSAAVGVAVLWLATHYLGRFGGFVRFPMSLGILVAVACLGVLSYSFELSREMPLFLVLLSLLDLVLLGAITLSRRLCGGKYRPARFMLWLALWTLLGSLVAIFAFVGVASLIMAGGPDLSKTLAVLMFILAGLTLGLCLYVLNLPFMILGFAHPFFRERFCACLGLKPMLAPAVPEAALDGVDMQDTKPQAP